MWIIELNVAGHRFTHRVPDRRHSGLSAIRLDRKAMYRYMPQLRPSRAA